jgi:hypothetical protein
MPDMKIDVLYAHDTSPGWAPITHMARLAAFSFGGASLGLDSHFAGRLRRILDLRPRRRANSDAGLLAILRAPSELLLLRNSKPFRNDYAFVAACALHIGVSARKSVEVHPPASYLATRSFTD